MEHNESKYESTKYGRTRALFSVLGWIGMVLAILSLVALLVCIVLLGWMGNKLALLGFLCLGTLCGAVVFGASAIFAMRFSDRFAERELDALEREDGENSFFVGEGTLATFEKERLRIHGEKRNLLLPYHELRFFSLCTRTSPREKGAWSVVIEIPASYFTHGARKKGEKPVLIQTDGKERLYNCLKAHGLALLGELPAEEEQEERAEFTLLRAFSIPDPAERKKTFLTAGLGALMIVGGIVSAFWWLSVGAVLIAFGLYLFLRAFLLRKTRQFCVYEEGIFMKEPVRSECAFLKWGEIERLTAEEHLIRAECLYGGYEFPRPAGAFEYLKERFPEKCGGGQCGN